VLNVKICDTIGTTLGCNVEIVLDFMCLERQKKRFVAIF